MTIYPIYIFIICSFDVIPFDDIIIVISFDMINLWEKYVKKNPEDWLAYFAIITHENDHVVN